jgi:inner membrane protein
MLIFAHTGITLGAATLVAGVANRRQAGRAAGMSWFASLSHYVDIRLLLVGSLLPDIIDKPVGQYFFRDTFSNGRIFAHTLLFLIVLVGTGFFLFKRYRQVWMFTLAAGTFCHLVLDEMWAAPATLFWPLLGLTFEKEELINWLSNILKALFSEPGIYIPELTGLVILLWFGLTLAFRKKIGAFLKYGKAG